MEELPSGELFAGYRIESLAGRGGMGVVYRATQLALDRPVALKLIASDHADDQAFRERFERESQLAASIDHVNVIPIYEAGEADGRLFIAMRFVPGTDLRELIVREGRLEPGRAVRIVEQVGAALDAAHRRGLVHRDVKPANVLIGAEDGEPEHAYLTDFGLTKQTAESGGLTATGQWVGTVDYVAPEQIEGKRLDAQTDVYALGCVLFQALTGTVPFAKDSDIAKLFAHASEPPPAPSSIVPGLPAELDAIVARALAKSPDDRHPSAGDLARQASAAVGGAPTVGPERSVATGFAAPALPGAESGTPTAPAGTPTAPAGTPTAPAPPAPPATPPAAPTVAAAGGEQAPPPGERSGSRRRLAALIGGPLAIVAIAIAALALAGVFGGDEAEEAQLPEPTGTPEVVATIQVGRGPGGIAVDGDDVWVALEREDSLARIDASTNEVVGEPVEVGERPAGVTADRGVAWVANSNEGTVRRVEAGGAGGPGVVGVAIPVGDGPVGISLGAQLAWVANSGDGTVSRLDRATTAGVGGPIGVGSEPVGLFVGRTGVWVTNRGDGTVSRIDPTTSQVIGDPIPVGSEPEGVAQGLRTVWVVSHGEGTVSRLDPRSGEPIGTTPVGDQPSGIAIGVDSAWVTVAADNTVARLDRDGRVVGSPVPVGTRPSGIAVGADGAVWVANTDDGTVSRIEP